MARDIAVTALSGGLDLVTPPMLKRSGRASASENYEPSEAGYTRVAGYERYDGQPSPAAAIYTVLPYVFGSVLPVAGQVIVGSVSGATGIVLEEPIPASGAFDGANAEGALMLLDAVGSFLIAEVLQVNGAQVAIADGVGSPGGNLNDDDDARLIEAAQEVRRQRISAVPGSGPVRGVATYRGETLAWRDNTAGTAGRMWKASPTGWVQQTFGHAIAFIAATAEFLEGETLTGGSSGASAVIRRVVLSGGAWSGAGIGRLILSGLSGVFQIGEFITSASGSATTATGAAPVRLEPGGAYRTIERNFYASEETTRLYVAYGTGVAFEWDGEVMAPILTGTPLPQDQPEHVAVHVGHLALGYRSGSVQLSEPGTPLGFRGDLGAAEFGFGTRITGLLSDAKGALFVAGANRMGYLTGGSAADFTLQIITDDSGALPGTLISANEPTYVDDRGIRRMSATEAFGDWRMGALSADVEPMIRARRNVGFLPVGMMRVKQKDQIRLAWPDGSGLTVFLGAEAPQSMPFRWGFKPSCVFSGEDENGRERLFAGSDNGMVYRMDVGPSFDGAEVMSFFRLAFDSQGSPGRMKRYHRVRLDGFSIGRLSSIGIGAEFCYAGEPAAARTAADLLGRGGAWDEIEYTPVVWSAPVQDHVFADLDGMGENIGIIVVSRSTRDDAHTLTAVSVHYSEKRQGKL